MRLTIGDASSWEREASTILEATRKYNVGWREPLLKDQLFTLASPADASLTHGWQNLTSQGLVSPSTDTVTSHNRSR